MNRLPGNFCRWKPMVFINCISFWFVCLFNTFIRLKFCHEFDPHTGQNFFLTKNAKNILAMTSSDLIYGINGPFLPNLHPFYENLSNSGLSFKLMIVRKITPKGNSENCQWSKNNFKWRIIVIFCHCRPNLHKLKRDESIVKFILIMNHTVWLI